MTAWYKPIIPCIILFEAQNVLSTKRWFKFTWYQMDISIPIPNRYRWNRVNQYNRYTWLRSLYLPTLQNFLSLKFDPNMNRKMTIVLEIVSSWWFVAPSIIRNAWRISNKILKKILNKITIVATRDYISLLPCYGSKIKITKSTR